jgi:hypothetical protein
MAAEALRSPLDATFERPWARPGGGGGELSTVERARLAVARTVREMNAACEPPRQRRRGPNTLPKQELQQPPPLGQSKWRPSDHDCRLALGALVVDLDLGDTTAIHNNAEGVDISLMNFEWAPSHTAATVQLERSLGFGPRAPSPIVRQRGPAHKVSGTMGKSPARGGSVPGAGDFGAPRLVAGPRYVRVLRAPRPWRLPGVLADYVGSNDELSTHARVDPWLIAPMSRSTRRRAVVVCCFCRCPVVAAAFLLLLLLLLVFYLLFAVLPTSLPTLVAVRVIVSAMATTTDACGAHVYAVGRYMPTKRRAASASHGGGGGGGGDHSARRWGGSLRLSESAEMRAQLEHSLAANRGAGIWLDEVASSLVPPLDALHFCAAGRSVRAPPRRVGGCVPKNIFFGGLFYVVGVFVCVCVWEGGGGQHRRLPGAPDSMRTIVKCNHNVHILASPPPPGPAHTHKCVHTCTHAHVWLGACGRTSAAAAPSPRRTAS